VNLKTLQNLVVLSRTILVVLFTFCGCATNQRHADPLDAEFFEREKDKFVTVYLDGDVKAHGQRQIRRALSRPNILEAAEGFAGLSVQTEIRDHPARPRQLQSSVQRNGTRQMEAFPC
jgi:hypothetical protein